MYIEIATQRRQKTKTNTALLKYYIYKNELTETQIADMLDIAYYA